MEGEKIARKAKQVARSTAEIDAACSRFFVTGSSPVLGNHGVLFQLFLPLSRSSRRAKRSDPSSASTSSSASTAGRRGAGRGLGRAAGGGGTRYSIILMYTYARVPRRAPGWAGRGFEVVAPLARAAQTVRAVHRDTRCSGQTSATLKWFLQLFCKT